MEDWNPDVSPYDVLELKSGASESEIKKKYRKLVLIKHPDKQPGNKKAAEEFIKIQRAYEILTDDKARAAFEGLQRAKDAQQAKQAGQSKKRQKFTEDLEKRERAYEAERTQEDSARRKLKEELARLRKSIVEREEQERAQLQAQAMRDRMAQVYSATASSSSQNQALRTIKVSWDSQAGTYSENQLREIFGTHGAVDEVVTRTSKKKGTASVLIVMGDEQGARNAIQAANGDLDNPLKVLPIKKEVGLTIGDHSLPAERQEGMPAHQSEGTRYGNGSTSQAREGLQHAAPAPSSGQLPQNSSHPVSAATKVHSAKPLFAAGSRIGQSSPMPGSVPNSLQTTQSESTILEKMRRRADAERAKKGERQSS